MARRPPTRHAPRDSSRRRLWVYFVLVAFLLVDVLLIMLALSSARAGAPGDAPRAIPTFTAVPNSPAPTSPAGTPRPTPTASQSATVVAVPPTLIISALDATTAWRAETGACPATPASPELTIDSGATWKSTDATGPAEVTAIQRIMVSSESVASIVGLAQADCAPQFVKTFVAGDNYSSYPDQLADTWYVNPADRGTVHSPAGDFKTPCAAVIVLTPRDGAAAAVLCVDGQVFTTTDAAKTWSRPATVSGAVNIAVTQTGYLAAAVGRVGCAGVQIVALTSDLEAGMTGCYPTNVAANSLPGKVALSSAGGVIWLWAADNVARSSDGGSTWR